MTRAVFALGAVMALVGLLVISYGIPLVRLEIGWTAVIGGSVAASAGCVILVLGVFLLRMEEMQASLDRLLPVATPDDLAAFVEPAPMAAEQEPYDLPAPLKPAHPLSPAARTREAQEEAVPEQVVTAAAGPPMELGPPLHPEPDWATEPTLAAEPLLDESAPALVHAEEETSHPPAVEAPDPVADPLAESPLSRPRPSFLSSLLARRGAAEPQRPNPATERFGRPRDLAGPAVEMPSLRDLPVDLSSGWDETGGSPLGRRTIPEPQVFETASEASFGFDREPPPVEPAYHPHADAAHEPEPERALADFAMAPVPDAPPPPPPLPDPLQPIVVGRYNAGSASYVMFSNGMIQVETEQGTHEFASMQDLKVFIERRDARAS